MNKQEDFDKLIGEIDSVLSRLMLLVKEEHPSGMFLNILALAHNRQTLKHHVEDMLEVMGRVTIALRPYNPKKGDSNVTSRGPKEGGSQSTEWRTRTRTREDSDVRKAV